MAHSSGGNGIYIDQAYDDGLEVGYDAALYGVFIPHVPATGVMSTGTAAGGYFADSDSQIYSWVGFDSYGILSNGIKSFIQQDPTDSTKSIIYASLEGGEAGTYYRGTGQLIGGSARISLPEHFSLVTEAEGLTVQITPRQDCNGLYVAEVTTTYIVVKELQGGKSNARFDFLINGVRAGYSDYQVTVDTATIEQAKYHPSDPGVSTAPLPSEPTSSATAH